jgi:hypothetical protein
MLPLFPSPQTIWCKGSPLPINISPKLLPDNIKQIRRIIGIILYYAWAVNITVLMALSSIAIEKTKGTTSMMEKAKQLLDYLATNPCNNSLLRIRHDHECPLRCIVLI